MARLAVLLLLSGCYGAGTYPEGGVDIGDGSGDGPRVDFGGDSTGSGGDADGDGDVGGGDTGDDIDVGGGGDVGADDPADWLCTPCTRQGMCGAADNACVRNGATGEQYCSLACDAGSCPAGYYCQDLGGGFPAQCLPDGDSCTDTGGGGDGGGDAGGGDDGGGLGGGDDGGGAGGAYGADVQHCLDVTNRYRADHGLGALTISDDVQQCAQEGAEQDSQSGMPHGHFSQTGGCGVAWAENEIPGWPQDGGGVTAVIDGGLQMMMDEGPGGGHYENILGDWTVMGCGVYVTGGGEVWVTQDFR